MDTEARVVKSNILFILARAARMLGKGELNHETGLKPPTFCSHVASATSVSFYWELKVGHTLFPGLFIANAYLNVHPWFP